VGLCTAERLASGVWATLLRLNILKRAMALYWEVCPEKKLLVQGPGLHRSIAFGVGPIDEKRIGERLNMACALTATNTVAVIPKGKVRYGGDAEIHYNWSNWSPIKNGVFGAFWPEIPKYGHSKKKFGRVKGTIRRCPAN